MPPTANTCPLSGKTYVTRASTAATSLNKALNARTTKESPTDKVPEDKMAEKSDPGAQCSTSNTSDTSPTTTPLQKIAATICQLISKDSLDPVTKQTLKDIIAYILMETKRENQTLAKSSASAEESTIRKSVKKDLNEMHHDINERLNGIQDTINETLTISSKLITDTEIVAAATKDLSVKVGKITDTAERIATDTSKYRDAVLTKPTQSIRAATDPKVLGDLDRKSRQILVEHLDTEGVNILDKSMTELTAKANEAICSIKDSGKPKGIKVQMLFKTR